MYIKIFKKALLILSIASILMSIGTVSCIKLTNRTVLINKDSKIEIIQNIKEENLLEYFEEPTVTIVDSDTKEEKVLKYSELGIERLIKDYSTTESKMIVDLNEIENNIDFKVNDDKLKEYIEKYNKDRVEWVYPTLVLEKDGFRVTEEITGKKINTEKVYLKIKENIGKDIKIETKDFLLERDNQKPTVETLNKELDKINNSYITYDNGFKISAVDMKDYFKIENSQIVLNKDTKEEFINTIDKLIETELKEYDTVGKGFEFKTTNGDNIIVKGGTWGNIFSSNKESEYIVETLGAFKSEDNRTPILTQEYANQIKDRYIEVSLDEQYLWFYDKGKLVMETKVVTGKKGKNDTPVGVYFISEMIPGKNLKGEDYVTWVNRWMRITNRGHGLHDAYWRNKFGGNIYKTNGSHGCINMPKSFAYELYSKLKVKDCVVIY